MQTYENIYHIVCTDDMASIAYVVESPIGHYVFVDRQQLIRADQEPKPTTGNVHLPHNLYLKELNKEVREGWIVYLDDDDYYASETAIEEIVNTIRQHDEDTVVFWQLRFGDGRTIPEEISDTKPPERFRVGGVCYCFHHKFAGQLHIDAWNCVDYRIAAQLYQIVPRRVFIPKVFVIVPSAGKGNREDIDETSSPCGHRGSPAGSPGPGTPRDPPTTG